MSLLSSVKHLRKNIFADLQILDPRQAGFHSLIHQFILLLVSLSYTSHYVTLALKDTQ